MFRCHPWTGVWLFDRHRRFCGSLNTTMLEEKSEGMEENIVFESL
jgi:hypothetical protein